MIANVVGWWIGQAVLFLLKLDRKVAREVIAQAAGNAARDTMWTAAIKQRVVDEWVKADKLTRRVQA